ncbi:MAG: RecX family transcriptional regulator [Lachnospiraceae bacterium]|nr:RecX family transcriptional regulator [Lachnospiraceae bacterium]
MKIDRLEEGTSGKYIIHLEDGTTFPIGKKESRNLELVEGKDLSIDQLEWIYEELVFPRGRNYLIYLLSSRDYTIKEIEEKFIKAGYPTTVIEQVIAYGVEKHYLDDLRYAEDYIRCHKGKKSIRQLCYLLERKGIPSCLLQQIPLEDDKEELMPMVKKYYEKKNGTPYERKAKTCQYFVRKGYSFSLIKELIWELDER